MTVTKQNLKDLKEQNINQLHSLIETADSAKKLLFILEHLGPLPKNFDGEILLPHLAHTQDAVRIWVVKTLAKLADSRYLALFWERATADSSSGVRREAVSAIGRLRITEAIPYLITLLADHDPNIVLQAMRGLFVFKERQEVQQALQTISHHPNELIQSAIRQELPPKPTKRKPLPTTPKQLHNLIVQGDVRQLLPQLPSESIHLTFTSPPYYNARDYAIYPSYEAYLQFLEGVFRELHRITREGRFLIINTSPVIMPRLSRAHASKRYPIPFDLHARLQPLGWEFIDDIVWVKPESSVKNRNGGFQQHRKPLGYKPNAITEYVMVYRKATDKLLDWNMHQYAPETITASLVEEPYQSTNVWNIAPTSDRIHTAVFPAELCRHIIRYYSYQGDLVFDPFGGSGTLGKVAQEERRYFLLAEQEESYIQLMREQFAKPMLTTQRPTRFCDTTNFYTLLLERVSDFSFAPK